MVSNEFDEVSMSSGSLYFDGAGDSLTVPSSAAFAFGTGDYTMECWVYPQNSGSDFFSGTSDLCNFGYTGGQFFFYTGTLNFFGTLVLNQWNHIAASRVSGTLNCYLNGVRGFTGSNSTNFSNQSIVIGINQSGSGGSLLGFLSNIRIVNGTALYTANFTPPQMALLPVTNTSLLLNNFAGEPFVDNSPNNFTITTNGTPSANTLSPFANTQRKVLNTGTMMVKEYDEVSFSPPSPPTPPTPPTPSLLFSNDGSTLSGWTVTDATVDDTLGNPLPSLLADPGQYAYINSGAASLLNTTITLDIYVRGFFINLCNFFFGCNATGSGYMLRLDSRGGELSGIATTGGWTNWDTPSIATRGFVAAETWHSVKIQIASNGDTSWYLNNVLVGSGTLTLSGTYIGIQGDGGAFGGNFDNIRIVSGIE
jgi:hypothetical protein